MRVPWSRHNFLARRDFERVVLDAPDALWRLVTGRRHWPPYSLRSFVGGARGFDHAGRWFLEDLKNLGFFARATRVFEIGCGCGRLARPFAVDEALRGLDVCYVGMDIDQAGIEWCQRHITSLNPRFRFYHADCYNASYNPHGSVPAASYRFPHPDASFDLILLTSVLTHVVAEELVHYLSEVARLLTPDGVAYASIFLLASPEDAASGMTRHPVSFPVARGDYSVTREEFPANAVGFTEAFVRGQVHDAGLKLLAPIRYGAQDILLLAKQTEPGDGLELKQGWHALEQDRWRWTERTFAVGLKRPPSHACTLRFRFNVAEAVLRETGPVRLRASIGDALLPVREYATAGEHVYVQSIPARVLHEDMLMIRFQLDQAYRPSPPDQRELGVQVAFWAYFNQTLRPICPISVIAETAG